MTDSQVDSHDAKSRGKSRRRNRLTALLLLVLVIVVPTGLFFVGPLALGAYDDSHVVPLVCTVTSAQGQSASVVSRTGIGGSSPQVSIRSNDCGTLIVKRGITNANRDQVASQFVRGDRYEFTVGRASLNLRSVLRVIRVAPEVFGFRAVS